MVGVLISLLVIVVMVRLLLKRYQPQIVLFAGGFILLFAAIFLGAGPAAILPAKIKSTGFIGFDPFMALEAIISNRVAGLGLIIMSAGGFAKYMNSIGASRAMVDVAVRPLRMISSPYIVLAMAFMIGQVLKMFIPSASGLGMLLMVTIFPILMRLGLSPLSSTAAVACTGGIDFGPADSQAILAAKTGNVDIAEYFITTLPVVIVSALVVAVVLVIVQIWMDKRDGHTISAGLESYNHVEDEDEKAPGIYMLLPALPLVLLLTFSSYGIASIRLNVVSVMLMSVAVAAIFEIFRHKGDVKSVCKQLMTFFEGMGQQFTNVVSIVVAGELFAQGLMAIGAVDTLIQGVQNSGFSSVAMVLIMTAFIGITAIIMGSGNAPFFAFAALVPKMAEGMGLTALSMIMPMQFAAGVGRIMSPITGAMIAEAGIAGVSSFDLVRRTFIPMLCGMIATTIMSLIVTM